MYSEDKKILLEILNEVQELKDSLHFVKRLIPDELSLSELAKIVGKTPNTLRKYLIANFEPEEDYKKRAGKIYVKQGVILQIRRHYES